jgi:hypothetical protein
MALYRPWPQCCAPGSYWRCTRSAQDPPVHRAACRRDPIRSPPLLQCLRRPRASATGERRRHGAGIEMRLWWGWTGKLEYLHLDLAGTTPRSRSCRQSCWPHGRCKVAPADHLVRQIDAALDLNWVHKELASYYSLTGRPSIDPVLMIRMLIVGYGLEQRVGWTASISGSTIAGVRAMPSGSAPTRRKW